MTHFVFCHGFGFDTHFWKRIAPYFSQEKCSFIDLGYFNKRTEIQHLENQAIVMPAAQEIILDLMKTPLNDDNSRFMGVVNEITRKYNWL